MTSSRVNPVPTVLYQATCDLSSCGQWVETFDTHDKATDALKAHNVRHCDSCYGFGGRHESWCETHPETRAKGSAAGPSSRMDPELSP